MAIRFGLCCQFSAEPIKFRAATAAFLQRSPLEEQRQKLAELCRHNAASLLRSLEYCAAKQIGAFRVLTPILPLKTHPEVGYELAELPGGPEIQAEFEQCGRYAASRGIRTSFHPDQFVVLNSLVAAVVRASVAELEYQAQVAEWIGADVIVVHAGGAYGDKGKSLERLQGVLNGLGPAVRSRIAIENDDKIYTPADLLPLLCAENLPFVYDVHHHRCRSDGLSVEQATQRACATWRREPLFHISSPKGGWDSGRPELHDDFVQAIDFPECWKHLTLTVEVEAKAKEKAVIKLRDELMFNEAQA